MGSSNTGAHVELTPGDGAKVRALSNQGAADIGVEYKTFTKHYGEQTKTITLKAGQVLPNDCEVISSTGIVFGYLQEGQ